ncbi:hypothetical protein B0H17DRAFT_1341483, partial [Mycena rosella]
MEISAEGLIPESLPCRPRIERAAPVSQHSNEFNSAGWWAYSTPSGTDITTLDTQWTRPVSTPQGLRRRHAPHTHTSPELVLAGSTPRTPSPASAPRAARPYAPRLSAARTPSLVRVPTQIRQTAKPARTSPPDWGFSRSAHQPPADTDSPSTRMHFPRTPPHFSPSAGNSRRTALAPYHPRAPADALVPARAFPRPFREPH